MPKNRSQMADLALRHIGVIDAMEASTAQDRILAEEAFDYIIAELNVHDLDYELDAEEIPDRLVVPLRDLIAHDVAPSFGLQPLIARNFAMDRLRQQYFQNIGDINAPVYIDPFR